MSKEAFLKNFLDEDLYIIPENNIDNGLANDHSNEIEADVEELKNIYFLGKNNKNISIIVREESSEFIAQTDLDLLEKIIGAIQLTIDDVAIINSFNSEINLDYIKSLPSNKCLIFDPKSTLISSSEYEIYEYEEMVIIKSESLRTIANNVTEKKKLWTVLQKVFM